MDLTTALITLLGVLIAIAWLLCLLIDAVALILRDLNLTRKDRR